MIPTPPDAVLERLGAAFVRADVVVRRPGDDQPPVFALLSGPDGCWCIDAGPQPLVAEPLPPTPREGEVGRRGVLGPRRGGDPAWLSGSRSPGC